MTAAPHPDSRVWRVRGAPLFPATADGPLRGETVAVKDLFAVAGYPIGAGVHEFRASRAPEAGHAAAVAALLGAGAAIAGIAQTDQFAYSIAGINADYGTPENPVAAHRIPGGSSSGPAVAVARGEASVGLGTDTAGSIRVPAAYQGLWGLRTTHGRVDTTGLLPLAPSFDTVGWITRRGETLQRVADVLLGEDAVFHGCAPADAPGLAGDGRHGPAIPFAGPGAGAAETGKCETVTDLVPMVVAPALDTVADPEISAAVVEAARVLGASAAEFPLPDCREPFVTVQAFEAWQSHGAWLRAHPTALTGDVAARFALAATIGTDQARTARVQLAEAASTLRSMLAGKALLLPTTATVAPSLAAGAEELNLVRTRTLRLTCLASLAGLPAVTFPAPGSPVVPIGLCLIGAPGTDRALIRLARSTAAALHAHPRSQEESR